MILFILCQIFIITFTFIYYEKVFKAYHTERKTKDEKRKMEFFNRIVISKK